MLKASTGRDTDDGDGCFFLPRGPSKRKFRESVRKCIDPNEVLTIAHRRLFSKRARKYMLAYSILGNSEEIESSDGVDDADKPPLLIAYLIEKIIKQYKSHRSALDFDTGFIIRVVKTMKDKQQHS